MGASAKKVDRQKTKMILVDTDILVDYFRDLEKSADFIDKNSDNICISHLTRLELLTGASNKNEMSKIDNRVQYPVLSQNNKIEEMAAGIIKKYFLKDGIGIIDSIIAATALYYNIDFYSNNIKHYKNIRSLKLKKPY